MNAVFGLSSLRASQLVALALVATSAPLMQSCSDEEIAVGAAVIAVGAAVHAGSHYGRCSYNERVCNSYTDYWGTRREECRVVRRNHRCYNPDFNGYTEADPIVTFSSFSAAAEDFKTQPVNEYLDVADVAKNYYLSLDSAELFVSALESFRQGKPEAVKAIGLTADDMNELAQLRVPGDASIDRMAKTLNQKPLFAKALLSKIVVHGHEMRKEECKKQREESTSPAAYDHYCLNNP